MTHFFSIIIPCHNDGAHVSRAIESVVGQSHDHWQIILVDDGSTDNTAEVAAGWTRRLGAKFIYHHQPNRGASAARNSGVAQAAKQWGQHQGQEQEQGAPGQRVEVDEHGEQRRYVVFLDADDELLAGALSTYARCLNDHPQVCWVIGAAQIEKGGRIKLRQFELPTSRHKRFSEFLEKKFAVGNVSNMCFAAELFDGLKFDQRLRVAEDVTLFALLFSITDPVVVNEAVAINHRRGGSLRTQSSFAELSESLVEAALFDHGQLAPEYQIYRPLFAARQGRSLARHAFVAGKYADVVHWSKVALSNKPGMCLNIKFMWRYGWARIIQSFS